MNKKSLTLLIIILLIFAWGTRFIYLNVSAEKPIIEIYEMGEKVYYGDNFYYYSDENRNGYNITVASAKLISYEDYAKENNLKLPELTSESVSGESIYNFRPQYVYNVEVILYNEIMTNGALDMFETLLVSGAVRMRVDETLWTLLYPKLNGSYAFRINDTEKRIYNLPFVIETASQEDIIDFNYLNNNIFYLTISQYPIKKVIKVNLNSYEN